MARLVDLSHEIVDGMTTYPGLPGPTIATHLSRGDTAPRLTGSLLRGDRRASRSGSAKLFEDMVHTRRLCPVRSFTSVERASHRCDVLSYREVDVVPMGFPGLGRSSLTFLLQGIIKPSHGL